MVSLSQPPAPQCLQRTGLNSEAPESVPMCVVRSRWALLSSGWWAPLNWAFCQPASVSITPYAVQAYRRLLPVRDENTCRHPMSTKDSKEVSAFVGPRESAQCLYWRRSVSYCANHDEKGQVVACFARRITLLYRVLLVLVQPEWSAPILQHWVSSSRSSSHRAAASLVFEGSETANPRRDYESSKLQSGPSNPISIPLPPLLSPQSSNFLLLLEPILSSFTILRYPHRPPIPSIGWFILRTPLRPRLQPDTPLCDSPAKVLTTNQQRISLLRPRAYKLTWTFNRRFAFWPASSRTISSSRLLSTLQIHVIRPSFDSGHGSHAFLETQVSELKLRIPSLSSSLRASDISVLDKRFNPSTHKLPAPS
jgi:hypothetical protein